MRFEQLIHHFIITNEQRFDIIVTDIIQKVISYGQQHKCEWMLLFWL